MRVGVGVMKLDDFKCRMCGACCRIKDGIVRVLDAEIARIAAFLGSQGDEWDAQKDILCDTLGAICSSGLFLWCVQSTGNRIGD